MWKADYPANFHACQYRYANQDVNTGNGYAYQDSRTIFDRIATGNLYRYWQGLYPWRKRQMA
jgi:hypothetical protein